MIFHNESLEEIKKRRIFLCEGSNEIDYIILLKNKISENYKIENIEKMSKKLVAREYTKAFCIIKKIKNKLDAK